MRGQDCADQPVARLAALQDFLRLATPIDAVGIGGSHSDTYLQDWEAMRTSRWRRAEYHRICEQYAAPLHRLGYDPVDLTLALDPRSLDQGGA